VITENGKIRILPDGREFNSFSMAAQEIVGHNINGWLWWRTLGNDGKEHLIDDFRKKKQN
jgi:hypothetical protein